MEGLEISVVKLSELNNESRVEAEYFSKENLKLLANLSNYGCIPILNVANSVTDGIHTSIDYDENSSINLISAGSPKENVFDLSRSVFISEKAHKENPRTALRKNDVVISTVGTIGNCAVVDESILPANSDRHVGIVRLNVEKYSPYVLSTFLLSKYGRMQTLRESTGNVQLSLFLYKIRELLIPNFSDTFQSKIESIVKSAHAKLEESKSLYSQAEDLLLGELGLKDWQPKNTLHTTKKFSDFAQNGRLDAEYYQPKYDDLFEKLSCLNCKRLGKIVSIKKSFDPGSDAYQETGIPFIRVSDISKDGIEKTELHLSPIDFDIPELKPKKDTILFSKDGSIGIAYKVQSDLNVFTSGALLHLVTTDSSILPDYLTLVLNSVVVKLQAERDSNGAIIQHWKPSDIENVIIPILPEQIQKKIASLIQQSFECKAQSKQLLEDAKRMVESEIEKN